MNDRKSDKILMVTVFCVKPCDFARLIYHYSLLH
jgi:hypothetical protein